MKFNWIVLSKQLFLQGATFLKRLCVHSKEAVMFLSPVCKAAHVEVNYTGCFFLTGTPLKVPSTEKLI